MAVRVNDSTGWKTIWLEEGAQGNQWKNAKIDLSAYANKTIQIQMDGTTGLGALSDIAFDNISVYSEVSTGIFESEEEIVTVYPNLTKDIINISLAEAVYSNTLVYDIGGRVVAATSANQKNYQINLVDLNAGVYIVRTITSDKVFTNRVVKQ